MSVRVIQKGYFTGLDYEERSNRENLIYLPVQIREQNEGLMSCIMKMIFPYRYSNLQTKLFLSFSLLEDTSGEARLQIWRMDNVTQGVLRHTQKDFLWKALTGWPALEIYLPTLRQTLQIPANIDYDSMQLNFLPQVKIENTMVKTIPDLEIPRVIYTVWEDDTIESSPIYLQKSLATWKVHNPHYELRYFSEKQSRETIAYLESPRVLRAYDQLVPISYRSDLWRAVILYWKGGIYFDAKLWSLAPLDTFLPPQGGLLAKDIPRGAVLTGFMALPPKDPFLRCAIDRIVHLVETRQYGVNALAITGPLLMGHCWNSLPRAHRHQNYRILTINPGGFLNYLGTPVLVTLNGEYRRVKSSVGMISHYSAYWQNGTVYGEWPPVRGAKFDKLFSLSLYALTGLSIVFCVSWILALCIFLFLVNDGKVKVQRIKGLTIKKAFHLKATVILVVIVGGLVFLWERWPEETRMIVTRTLVKTLKAKIATILSFFLVMTIYSLLFFY